MRSKHAKLRKKRIVKLKSLTASRKLINYKLSSSNSLKNSNKNV